MDLAEIQRAIEALLPDEQQALLRWLEDRDNDRWDAEMERDFSAGSRGMKLLEQVDREIDAGRLRLY